MAESKTDQDKAPRKLYRCQANRVIGGVAAGLAKYFDIDVIVVRIVFILAVFLGGLGLPAYIIAWVIIPKYDMEGEPEKEKSNQSTLIWGALFIILGFIILGRQLYWWDYDNFYYDWHWHPWSFFGMDFDFVIPVILILAGIFYLVKTRKEKEDGVDAPKQISGENKMEKKLTRTVDEKMVAGVCGGLAKYLNVDVSIVRIAFAVLTIGSGFFTGVIVYAAMIFIVPEEDAEETTEAKATAETKTSTAASATKSTVAKTTTAKSTSAKPKAKPRAAAKSSKSKKDESAEGN